MKLIVHSYYAYQQALFKGILLCCLVLPVSARAQVSPPPGHTVSGTVSDAETGEKLPMVSIFLQGSRKGVLSDNNGQYKLVASGSVENEKVVFSLVGYKQQEVKLPPGGQLNILLVKTATALNSVVVVGYGTQKASQVTNSIVKITGEQLNDRPAGRIDRAMQGKLAGVQVQEINGNPGASLSVKVRGVSSINYGNAPLYVIDGFPVSTGLDNINPNDIASIEVLKDAASAAIYGSRGAHGVVLVTTKSGQAGKTVLQLDMYTGFQKRMSKFDMMSRDEWIPFAIEERNNSWVLQGGNATDANNKRSNAAYWIDPLWLTGPGSLPDNDWQKAMEQSAPIQNYQLSASGGTDKVKYYISGNYFNQKGIITGSDYKRLSFRSNVETKFGERVNLGLNLSAASNTGNDAGQVPNTNSPIVAPVVPLDLNTQDAGFHTYSATSVVNPAIYARTVTNETGGKNIRANTYLTIRLLDNLQLRSSVGADYQTNINQYYIPYNVNRGAGSQGSTSTDQRENYLTEHTLTYRLNNTDWNLTALAGFSYQYDKLFSSSAARMGFSDDEITTINAGSTLTGASSSITEWNLVSFFGRVNFAWKDKYMIAASLRRDGSSRFGWNNNWGYFPSASLGWNLANEPFLQQNNTISNLKLRASYGAAGNNNIGNYAALATMNNANYVLGPGGGQSLANGYIPASYANPGLGWEKTYTLDGGIDMGLFRNRINLTLDFYQADTKDLLLNVSIPSITGFSSTIMNIGKVRNKGIELGLNTVNISGVFNWSTDFNITHNTNKVLALGPTGAPVYGSAGNTPQLTITKIGEPIGSYYLFVQEGVFMNKADFDSHPHYKIQNIGDIKYKDINGDGVIDQNDRAITGNNNPTFFWGMQNNFSCKNFDMAVSLDGQWGNKTIDAIAAQDGQSRWNVQRYWNKRWRSESDPGNGWVPRAAVTSNLTTPSTFWMRSAAYWRLRTIALGYTVPDAFMKKIGAISGLRISVSADNVYQHDDNHGVPQSGNASPASSTVSGVDFGGPYPLARTFTFNLNVKF